MNIVLNVYDKGCIIFCPAIGDLAIPLHGLVLLWGLAVLLLFISLVELVFNLQAGSHNEGKKE
jgi:hypothetical protein